MAVFETAEFVLAHIDTPSVFNFYPSREAAEADRDRANSKERGFRDYKYAVMTYGEFAAKRKEFWLKDGIQEIDEPRYTYALEVLPPMRWRQRGGLQTFCMSERTSGTFTEQYAAYKGRFFSKMIDLADASTEITPEALDGLMKAETTRYTDPREGQE